MTAFLTVTVSAAGLAQPANRITDRNDDFGDVNRLIRDGSTTVPGFGFGSGTTIGTQPIDVSRVDKTAVRNLLAESIDQSEQLIRLLQLEFQRYPSLRPFITDMLSVRVKATRIAQDLQANVDLKLLVPQFQQLDSDWRLVSHQMSQTRELSSTARDKVTRIDRLGRELEKLFKMEPQLDRRALSTQLSNLSSSLRNLVEELEFDPSGGDRLAQLILDARKLNQQVARVQNIVLDQYPHTAIVTEYNRFKQTWAAMSPGLRQLSNSYVDRSVRQVAAADSNMHNLLWLEQQTSRENLRLIADTLSRDVDEFFNRVPLKLLLYFKNVNRILDTSDDFYGTVQNFKDCVARNEDERTMLECYKYVEEYGNIFIRDFGALRSKTGQVVLRAIEDDIVALRNELRLTGTVTSVDTQKMIPSAAALENLADHLDFDVQQWLNRDRQTFRTQALTASSNFVKRTQLIHRQLASRASAAELKTEVNNLIEEWRTIYQYLGRCNTEHREHLRVLSQDISQQIYDLRAPLQL